MPRPIAICVDGHRLPAHGHRRQWRRAALARIPAAGRRQRAGPADRGRGAAMGRARRPTVPRATARSPMRRRSGRCGYGALAAAAAKITLAQEPAIKTPDQFTPDRPAAGAARHGAQGQRPGQIRHRHPARRHGLCRGHDLSGVRRHGQTGRRRQAIKGRRGIQQIVPVPGGVAVVADRFWRAKQAVADLLITWDEGAGAGTNSDEFAQGISRCARRAGGQSPSARAT